MPTQRLPTPSATLLIVASVKRLVLPAFKKAITPLPTITGRSMKVRRALKRSSAFL